MKTELKKCKPEYWEFVRNLRNNKDVIDGFIKSEYITKESQIKYMEIYSEYYRICLYDGIPVGFVGVLDGDIRVCTHPDYQQKGFGKFMIQKIMEIFPNSYAKVKINNIASKNLFKSLGFNESFVIYTKNL